MKRNLWFTALVGAALTGCVSEEISQVEKQKEMLSFTSPVMATQTRANVFGEIEKKYPAAEEFMVFCKTYTDKFNGWKAFDEETGKGTQEFLDYFDANGEVAKNNKTVGATEGEGEGEGEGEEAVGTETETKYWATDNVHYWPEAEFNLAFAAYSPATLTTQPTSIKYTEKGLEIENFQTEVTADNQYDLMYSNIEYGLNKTTNAGAAVPLTFNHALSSIVFSSQKANDDVDYIITGLELSGSFDQKANFIQNIESQIEANALTTSIKGEPTWTYNNDTETNDETKVNYKPSFTQFHVPSASPSQFTSGTSALLLIPQNIPTNAEVTVYYTKITYPVPNDKTKKITMETYATIKLTDFTQTTNPTHENGKITEWVMGKRYVYRIAFGENTRIYFEPTVADWIQEPTLVYTIQ